MAETVTGEMAQAWNEIHKLRAENAEMRGFFKGMQAQKEHYLMDQKMYGQEDAKARVGSGSLPLGILGTIGFGIAVLDSLGG